MRNLGDGHQVKCHLPAEVFAKMEPVISFGTDEDDASGHGTPGTGPGFIGTPPRRPRGKTASPGASAAGGSFEDSEASSRLRREDRQEDRSETGARDTGEGDGLRQVGWGSQIDDADAPSPFEQTIDERAEDADRKKPR